MNDFDFISALNSFNEKYLPKILIFLLVFVVGSLIVKLLLKLIRKIIDKSKIERTVITFFFSILKIVLYLIVVMTALSTIGVNVSSIITTFAAAAITAGLAFFPENGRSSKELVKRADFAMYQPVGNDRRDIYEISEEEVTENPLQSEQVKI